VGQARMSAAQFTACSRLRAWMAILASTMMLMIFLVKMMMITRVIYQLNRVISVT
jgi:hypothetical protein